MEPRISCADLFLRLEEDEVLVVDCRNFDASDVEDGQIPGALRMTPEELAFAGHVLPDDELIVLCGSARDGSDVRRAWRALVRQGFFAVCLDGGLPGWIRAGYPVDTGSPYSSRRLPSVMGDETPTTVSIPS